jgi:hypothetical protein
MVQLLGLGIGTRGKPAPTGESSADAGGESSADAGGESSASGSESSADAGGESSASGSESSASGSESSADASGGESGESSADGASSGDTSSGDTSSGASSGDTSSGDTSSGASSGSASGSDGDPRGQRWSRMLSVLGRKAPLTRTCADTGMPSMFCLCMVPRQLDIDSERVHSLANAAVSHARAAVDALPPEMRGRCRDLVLADILEASEQVIEQVSERRLWNPSQIKATGGFGTGLAANQLRSSTKPSIHRSI